MQKELLFAKEYGANKNGACACYLPEYKSIYVKWRGHPMTVEFKEILNLVLEFEEKLSCKNWFFDMSELEPTSEESDRWIKETYTGGMGKSKLQKFAVLLPTELMAHFSISEMTDGIKAEGEKGNVAFETRYF